MRALKLLAPRSPLHEAGERSFASFALHRIEHELPMLATVRLKRRLADAR